MNLPIIVSSFVRRIAGTDYMSNRGAKVLNRTPGADTFCTGDYGRAFNEAMGKIKKIVDEAAAKADSYAVKKNITKEEAYSKLLYDRCFDINKIIGLLTDKKEGTILDSLSNLKLKDSAKASENAQNLYTYLKSLPIKDDGWNNIMMNTYKFVLSRMDFAVK